MPGNAESADEMLKSAKKKKKKAVEILQIEKILNVRTFPHFALH